MTEARLFTPASEPVLFYRATGEYGFLSNLHVEPLFFARRPILLGPDGQYPPVIEVGWAKVGTLGRCAFQSAEHAYQAAKPKNPVVGAWIAQAPAPRMAAQIGHALLPYDIRPDWSEFRLSWMREVVLQKFRSTPSLREKLLDTRTSELVENSKDRGDRVSKFWGRRTDGVGENWLGRILMETRERLREPDA